MRDSGSAKKSIRTAKPSFDELKHLRREWRKHHERQDLENAEQVFRSAGIELVTDQDLKFFPHLFRQKLNEFGRDWERALAAQALREGYSFYRAELKIDISLSNAFYQTMEKILEPYGAALFYESNGLHALREGTWDALFYFVLRKDIDLESLPFENSPGLVGTPRFLKLL